MKKILLFLCIGFIPSLLFSQRIDELKIHSNVLDCEREIIVYTPWEYDHITDSKFEVIYVFDAQDRNHFDIIYSTLSFLNNSQFPMIVVGVVSEKRNSDFLPGKEYQEDTWHLSDYRGNAEYFLNFVSNELVPYIDNTYRTLPKRIAIGHSNGGTFLMFSLTKKPELFDAYLLISPNCAYHNEQPVRRLAGLDPQSLLAEKYIYMCNSDEEKYWKDWAPARKKAIELLKTKQFRKKIFFENQDFSTTENHTTVYPIGVFYGLKNYLNYQFFNAENLIAYYSELKAGNIMDFTPDKLNQLANEFYYDRRPDESIKILLWANKLYPEDLNLYESLGEMYQNKGKKSEAMKYYLMYEEILEQRKEQWSAEDYETLRRNIEDRIARLNEM